MSEKRMSEYGTKLYSPQEKVGFWKSIVWRTDDIAKKHLSSIGDGSVHWPGVKQWSRHEIDKCIAEGQAVGFGVRTRQTVADVKTPYERIFYQPKGYDAKMHRDDRRNRHIIGCSIHDEETRRPVPVLSSSVYGSRLHKPLESFARDHVYVEYVMHDFYKKRGTGLPPIDAISRRCHPPFT